MKNVWMIPMIALALVSCGDDPTRDPIDLPNRGDAGNDVPEKTGTVTRCLGPSCPRGECGFSGDCSAYAGFDALDSSQLCSAATGAKEFCLEYEVPKDGGFVDIFEQVISCADPTVVKKSCGAGCGYNYSPDDCAVCNGDDGCAFD